MKIKINTKKGKQPDTFILPFLKGQVDSEMIKDLTGLMPENDFDGSFKSYLKLYLSSGKTCILVGLGEESDLGRWHQAFRLLAFREGKSWDKGISVVCQHLMPDVQEAAALGFQLATYSLGAYKTDKAKWPYDNFQIYVPGGSEKRIKAGLIQGETITGIMKLVDAPGNKKPPSYLGEWALESAKKYGYKAEVYHEKRLIKEGLHALAAVGKGSKYPPVLIKVEYKPKGLKKDTPILGLAGKGVTFDTGGLSIKNSQNLHYMKSDMGGAAAVLGAVELAARLQLNVHIIGIIGAAENAVDAESYRPGDVIDSYSGKTIEIIDTDAEGRLILADTLSYLNRKYKPHWIIDLATLTGSAVLALGYSSGALFTNSDTLARALESSGDNVYERVWRMPLYTEFNSEIESDIADVRNLSGKPVAGAITAAKFLEYFTDEHPRWAHLDIAGVAFGDSDFAKMKSATGFGPRLLIDVMHQLYENL